MNIEGFKTRIIFEIAIKPDVKSKIIKRVLRGFWPGYKSSDYVYNSQNAWTAMEEVIKTGVVAYIPTKPLKIIPDMLDRMEEESIKSIETYTNKGWTGTIELRSAVLYLLTLYQIRGVRTMLKAEKLIKDGKCCKCKEIISADSTVLVEEGPGGKRKEYCKAHGTERLEEGKNHLFLIEKQIYGQQGA